MFLAVRRGKYTHSHEISDKFLNHFVSNKANGTFILDKVKKHYTINQGQYYVKAELNANMQPCRQLFVSGWVQATEATNRVPANCLSSKCIVCCSESRDDRKHYVHLGDNWVPYWLLYFMLLRRARKTQTGRFAVRTPSCH